MSTWLTLDDLKRVIHDSKRLFALKCTGLLDTPPEEAFDRFTRLTLRLLKVTAAFVSLVDDKRVFFKSYSGIGPPLADTREVPFESSFCPHAVARGKLLLVSDARTDPQFQTHPAFREFNTIAYAGMPLVTADGHALGTFGVIDAEPRGWTQDEIDLLTGLGVAVVSEIEFRISGAQRLENAVRLEASEQRFRTAFHANPLPISIVSYPDGHILEVNQAVVRQLGYQRDDIVGRTTAELQVYTDPVEREEFFRILREQGRVIDFEARLKTKDGDARLYLISSEIIELDGRTCLLTSTNDITARKCAETALQQALERLELAQSAGSSGTFDWNIATNELLWSEAEGKLYGLEPGGFEGKYENWRGSVHPDDIEKAETEILNAINDRLEINTEFRIIRPDGTIRWIYATGNVIYDARGTPLRMIGINVDITERKSVEVALRESEACFALAARALRGIIYDWDVKSDRIKLSAGLYDILGLRVDEVPGTGVWWASLQHPEDKERVRAVFRDAVDGGGDTFNYEYRALTKGGEYVWVWDHGVLVRNEAREVKRVVGTTLDIDKRKRSELLLREANRGKDEFLAMLAHELRNPLAPMLNAVQVLNTSRSTKAQLKSARDVVVRQVKHMTRLIDDLVDAARLTHGKFTLKKAKVELATVIGDAVDMARPIIISRGHILKIESPRELTPLYGDGTRLSQAIGNILTNAAKYTQPGGTIELTVVKSISEIAIHVRDNGIGIAPDTLTHVFELFTQSERTLDQAQGGLGIGLALVKRLIEMHGGQVEAHSAGIGHGSEFVLRLPIAHDTFESFQPFEKIIESNAKKPLRILVVDDNEDSAEVTAILLKLEGHDVTVAHNGPDAIKQVNAVLPDVLLLDIGLPGMDGYELARHLRDLPETRHAVFIALTGYGRPEDRQNAQHAGYDHHLVKPIEPAELIDLIAALR